MQSVLEIVSNRVAEALERMGSPGSPFVAPSQDEKFGDYQSNAAMGLAKRLGKKPREVAEQIIAALHIDEICEPPEIAGPGFINLRLKPSYLATTLREIPTVAVKETSVDRVGIAPTTKPETVVVDLSSPNLAKEMHVGHLRSTVIGDCVARVLEFAGHNVIRENHVGDWGTQFGMLVAYLRRIKPDIIARPDSIEIADLESFYVQAKTLFDADEKFRDESRETVVALQKGDPTVRLIWKAFCDESLRHCHEIYKRLGVQLIDRGESFYNELMDEVVRRLEQKRDSGADPAIRDSAGALCIFPEGFTTREGEPLPVIVRKSDGGFNYATSDLATIIHRVEALQATRIIYVVGLSQKQHFDMLFAAAPRVVKIGPGVRMQHLGFGNMLAPGGRPFKTREGGTIKLKNLLDEAVARARQVIESRATVDDDTAPSKSVQTEEVAEVVGLGAIKYFDLSHSLSSDYTFDIDTMLSLEGNTAPYMMYAYARIRSIGRKAEIDFAELSADAAIVLEHPTEIALAKKLVQFAEKFAIVESELRPNVLTDYLYELAKSFSRFYDKKLGVRVIDASPESLRVSRLRLCDLTARTLKLGLFLLGIQTIEHM
jgi:arginyl-tRNA synthetase